MALPRTHAAPAASLIDAALPHMAGRMPVWFRSLVFVAAGSLLLTLSAKVQVPMWPVPMTMQSFAVLFLGAALGPRLGAASVAFYLAQGFAGLPVFAMPGAAGPGYFLGSTGGFLLSFIPAAYVAGLFAARGASLLKVSAGMTFAHALILVIGMAWLAFFAQLASGATGIGLSRAFAVGVQPFIVGSVVKVALATALVAAGWTALRRR
ncbi:MAG: biotin transporter BioY [Hyphomicrobiales bacterium]|nr:biotin transporter BioY [Hyphomicrobiales bacterium]